MDISSFSIPFFSPYCRECFCRRQKMRLRSCHHVITLGFLLSQPLWHHAAARYATLPPLLFFFLSMSCHIYRLFAFLCLQVIFTPDEGDRGRALRHYRAFHAMKDAADDYLCRSIRRADRSRRHASFACFFSIAFSPRGAVIFQTGIRCRRHAVIIVDAAAMRAPRPPCRCCRFSRQSRRLAAPTPALFFFATICFLLPSRQV